MDLSIPDIAINGVQVENHGEVNKIITAVDFSKQLLHEIKGLGGDLILVHHGIFWGKPIPIVGRHYALIKELIIDNIALMAYHLPLDVHPNFGNNILLLKTLGFKFEKKFGDYRGTNIIFSGTREKKISINDLVDRVKGKIGEPLKVIYSSKKLVHRIGVCTGGGLFGIEKASEYGCDAYITGDASHTSYHLAKELDINLICGGHYNTEVLGIKTLGEKISKKFSLPNVFVDLPTGL